MHYNTCLFLAIVMIQLLRVNICVFTHTFPRFHGDPIAPFIKDFAYGLSNCNNNVVVLTPYDKHFSPDKNLKSMRIKLYKYIIPDRFHVLGYSRTLAGDQKLKLFVYPLAPLMFLFSFIALLKTIYTYKIQIISAHWILPNGFIGAIVSKISGIPLVVSVPGSDVYLAKKNLVFKIMAKIATKQASYIVSNSLRYLDELGNIGIDRKKFKEIPYGVDINRYTYPPKDKLRLRERYGIKENEKIILAIGRLVEKKGFEYLIKAMPLVLEKLSQTRLIIIGDGDEKNKLERLASNLYVANKITFVGKVNHNDLPSYYEASDIYVAPSIKDSHGNLESHIVALFEAIAAGLPVVTTKLGASEKYVINGKNGYRVNEKDEISISKSIVSILTSINIGEMGKESRRIAKKYLSYDVCVKEYSFLFKSLVYNK